MSRIGGLDQRTCHSGSGAGFSSGSTVMSWTDPRVSACCGGMAEEVPPSSCATLCSNCPRLPLQFGRRGVRGPALSLGAASGPADAHGGSRVMRFHEAALMRLEWPRRYGAPPLRCAAAVAATPLRQTSGQTPVLEPPPQPPTTGSADGVTGLSERATSPRKPSNSGKTLVGDPPNPHHSRRYVGGAPYSIQPPPKNASRRRVHLLDDDHPRDRVVLRVLDQHSAQAVHVTERDDATHAIPLVAPCPPRCMLVALKR